MINDERGQGHFNPIMQSWTGLLHLVAVVWEPIGLADLHEDSCVGTTIIVLVGERRMTKPWRGQIVGPTSKFLRPLYNHADRE